jgi:hypothetical protein
MERAPHKIERGRVSRGVILDEVPRHTAVLDVLKERLLFEVRRICHNAGHSKGRNSN